MQHSCGIAWSSSSQGKFILRPRILLVASEAIPLIKTGGLADVISSMALALRKRDVDVHLLLPGYPAAMAGAARLTALASFDDLPGGPGCIYRGEIADSGIPVLLLETEGFSRRTGNPYVDDEGCEYPDNATSFAALAHAAVRICEGRTALPVPHVVHANDWHAALIPVLLHLAGVNEVASVLTIHNLAFQGNYPLELAPSLGIPESMLGADGIEFWGKLSFLKAGIRHADRISIVSESYAKEVLTPRFGCGLEGILQDRQDAIVPIPNGIDVDSWNPAKDALITAHFSANDMRNKTVCRHELLNLFGLPVGLSGPVLALGSRITHQKMADVVLDALPAILDRNPRMQAVVLGQGDHDFERGFLGLAERYPGRLGVHIGYDERYAHALHAGADMLLHGTRFEPFGLTPIYAMRYGTIPIASRVGGLIDTIVDAGVQELVPRGANGLLFDGEQVEDMVAAVDRAVALYGDNDAWESLQRNAMSGDFSWDGPARRYIAMYREAAPSVAHLFTDKPPQDDDQAWPALAIA